MCLGLKSAKIIESRQNIFEWRGQLGKMLTEQETIEYSKKLQEHYELMGVGKCFNYEFLQKPIPLNAKSLGDV